VINVHLQYLYAEDKLGLYLHLYAEDKWQVRPAPVPVPVRWRKLGLYLYLYAELLKIMNVQSLTVATDRQDTDFERWVRDLLVVELDRYQVFTCTTRTVYNTPLDVQ